MFQSTAVSLDDVWGESTNLRDSRPTTASSPPQSSDESEDRRLVRKHHKRPGKHTSEHDRSRNYLYSSKHHSTTKRLSKTGARRRRDPDPDDDDDDDEAATMRLSRRRRRRLEQYLESIEGEEDENAEGSSDEISMCTRALRDLSEELYMLRSICFQQRKQHRISLVVAAIVSVTLLCLMLHSHKKLAYATEALAQWKP